MKPPLALSSHSYYRPARPVHENEEAPPFRRGFRPSAAMASRRCSFACAAFGFLPFAHGVGDLKDLLARCADVIREHDKTALTFPSLPDSEAKRAMLAQFEESLRVASA